VIDLHSHILPGVDDGARTLEDSLGIARASVDVGVETMAATPHVRGDYPTSAETMERLLASTRQALATAGIPLELLPGGEIALDYLPHLEEQELARFGLGGNPDLLLLEFPYVGWPPDLAAKLAALRDRGVRVVLAHPERSSEVQAAPAHLWPLVEAGTLVQLTAASVSGTFGDGPRGAALDLLELDLAHLVAGDVHSPGARGAALAEVTSALGGDERLAAWLTAEVPAALLRGDALPQRPPRSSRGLRRGLNPFRRRR
jgi:protein-tyrosine phosphatase